MNNLKKTLSVILLSLPLAAMAEQEFAAVAACRQYRKIESFSAETRRVVTDGAGKSVKTLSTVYMERPGKFHSETVRPLRRRVVCDGKVLKYAIDDGSDKGVFCPVEKLPPQWLANISTVPGSPEYEVSAIPSNAVEKILAPLPGYAMRASYSTDASVITVDIDSEGRLCRLEVADSSNPGKAVVSVAYSEWKEVAQGVWLPMNVKTVSGGGPRPVTDVLRLDNVSVNETISQGLFKTDAFFEGVKFEAL